MTRWKNNLWHAPIGWFDLQESINGEWTLEDGDGAHLCELAATNREDAIREAEEWILRRCQETAEELTHR